MAIDISWFINHSKYVNISTINHSEIGVIGTNLADSELGHHVNWSLFHNLSWFINHSKYIHIL